MTDEWESMTDDELLSELFEDKYVYSSLFEAMVPKEFNVIVEDVDRNRLKEYNDCSVVAVVLATGLPYSQVHEALEVGGRKWRGGARQSNIHNTLRELGFSAIRMDYDVISDVFDSMPAPANKAKRLNLKSITKYPEAFPKGTYLAYVAGHVLCIKDKRVLDSTFNQGKRIVSLFKIVKR